MTTLSVDPRRSLSTRDVMMALGILALFVVPLFAWKFHPFREPIDLAVYRAAGRAVLHGGNLYARSFELRVPLPFTYPPFAALLAVPAGVLPTSAATIVWTAVSLGCLIGFVFLAFRPWLIRAEHPGVLLGVLAAAFAWTTPVTDTLWFGQINLLLGLMCLADCTRSTKRRGVLVGVATAMKLLPGLFIVYFAVTKQWRAARTAVMTSVGCWVLAAAVLPRASAHYWSGSLIDANRVGTPGFFSNQSLYGLVSRLHGPLWVWAVMSVAAGFLGLARAASAHARGDEIAAVAIVGLTTLLVSPVSWQHHAIWIIPAVGALVGEHKDPPRALLALIALMIFWVRLPFFGNEMAHSGGTAPLATLVENAYVLAYVALIALLKPTHSGSLVAT